MIAEFGPDQLVWGSGVQGIVDAHMPEYSEADRLKVKGRQPAAPAGVFKALILRYGGAKLYKGLRSFFFGLILGEIVGAGAWAVIDFFTGRIGNTLTQV